MESRLAIAHVSPYPIESEHPVNAHIARLTEALRARGHTAVAIAPSRSANRVRATRAALRAHAEIATLAQAADSEGFIAIAEAVRSGAPSRPRAPGATVSIEQGRALEELFAAVAIDLLHVHDPLPAGAASAALRHSRSLNTATFHLAAGTPLRELSRRIGESISLFGRIDAASAPSAAAAAAAAELLAVRCEIVAPGWSLRGSEGKQGVPQSASALWPLATGSARQAADARGQATDPTRILYAAAEERAALRLHLRALRRLPERLRWQALVATPTIEDRPERALATLRGALRERVRLTSVPATEREELCEGADIAVFASSGAAPDHPGLLRALGSGAAVLASRVPLHEELLGEGERGLLFEPGDLAGLLAQLQRLIGDRPLRERLARAGKSFAAAHSWQRAAQETEAIYEELIARRHAPPVPLRAQARTKAIDVDLHMHTDHSPDCATPVEVLLSTARERGLGAIAVTDHNEISGALAAAELGERYGVKVIVGEEVKTASEGEVIGLFLSERIPRGLSLAETIAQIKAQGGIVYIPHPFDRLHPVPDYANLLPLLAQIDAIEVYNARVAISAFNEEAARFAAKYRILAGAGSDAHVPQGLGSVRVRMPDFEGPQQFLSALAEAEIIASPKSLLYVQALKLIQTRAGGPQLRRLREASRQAR
ncbi:MAG TPA: PHP domain-containing protein [Solirubrobacteraceae bacterium]|nr:PHP domain-containing protein [Solirubrobacteraceae bacterium]